MVSPVKSNLNVMSPCLKSKEETGITFETFTLPYAGVYLLVRFVMKVSFASSSFSSVVVLAANL